jgi:hypothetical protein
MTRLQNYPDSRFVGELAAMGCSNAEIAELLDCSQKTIEAKCFVAILAKNRAELRKNLRQAQIEAALGGNVKMLMWLGIQLLGQTDENQVQFDGDSGPHPEQLIVVLDEKEKPEMVDSEITPATNSALNRD